MSKDKMPTKLEPRLRFPEFAGEPLHHLQLGNVTEDCTERNGKGATSALIMGVSKVDGIVPMEERLIGKDTARYKCLETNWFAYNPMRLNIGSIARWKGDEDVLVSPDYVVFRCITEREPSIDPDYLDHFRYSDQWERFVGGSGDGGVRIRIYYKDLAQLPITLPRPAEQRKIAECLGSLDDWIAAETEALAALRRHKAGLMQQLFPRPGETRPRFRFPEFRDAGVWLDAKLGGLAEIVRGGSPRPIDKYLTRDADGLNWLKIGDLDPGAKYVTGTEDRVISEALSKTRVIEPGDLILSNSMSFGRPYLSQITTCIHDGWIAVRKIKKRVRSEFLYYAIMAPATQAFFEDWASGGGIRNLNIDIVKSAPMWHPDPNEQDQIANCLASLDVLLASKAEKLATLQDHKRGLMQQLFPKPDAAEGGD